jgi:hypothetical protein
MHVSLYLHEVSQGCVTDYKKVLELAGMNGDLGGLGDLLKSGSPMTNALHSSVMPPSRLGSQKSKIHRIKWAGL